jgi:nucleosome binding factor SPN SPT16 subunit
VDTVLVNHNDAALLTEGAKVAKDTLFFLSNGEDESKVSSKPTKKPPVKPLLNGNNGSPAKNKTVAGKVLRNKTRSAAQEEVLMSTAAKIAEHQKELHSHTQSEGLAKYSEEGGGGGGKEGKSWKRFQSYKGEAALPPQSESLRVSPESIPFLTSAIDTVFISQIYVDRKAQTIILPIHGFAVPFHINTIKNAAKNDEGDFTFLRINFQTPGQLAGRKEDTVCFNSVLALALSHLSYSLLKIPMLHLSAPLPIALQTVTASITSPNKSPS